MDADAPGLYDRAHERARQQCNSQPGANAAEDGLKRPELQLTLDSDTAAREVSFKHLSVGASSAQHYRSHSAILENCGQRRDIWGRQNDEFLAKDYLLFKRWMRNGATHKGSVELLIRDRRDQVTRRTGMERQVDFRVLDRVSRQERCEAQRGRRFQRTDCEWTARGTVVSCSALRVGKQPRRLFCVREQPAFGRRQGNAAAVSIEQRAADVRFQGFDAGRHIGLHGVELCSRSSLHAAAPGNGFEDFQIADVHDRLIKISLNQIDLITSNRFLKSPKGSTSVRMRNPDTAIGAACRQEIILVASAGSAALAAAVGIGQFVYTPILPRMIEALGLSKSTAGLMASADFLGYLVGAFLVASPLLVGSRRTWLLGTLVMSAITTGAMGLTNNVTLFVGLRFVGGAASAFVLVLASALVLERLAGTRHTGLSALCFAGVGIGIAISAMLVAAMLKVGHNWKSLWLASGALSLIVTIAVGIILRPQSMPPPRTEGVQRAGRRNLTRLIAAYGLFGFGYVITATFLVAIVRTTPTIRSLEPVIWLVFGVAAAPSVAVWTRLGTSLESSRPKLVSFFRPCWWAGSSWG